MVDPISYTRVDTEGQQRGFGRAVAAGPVIRSPASSLANLPGKIAEGSTFTDKEKAKKKT